jgi:hypothetical protein
VSREADEVVTRSGGDRSMLGMALLAAGTLWLLGELGLFHVAGRTLASVALVCIGAGLILTRRTGRRRWPILVGGILALSLLGNSASANFRSRYGGGFGSHTWVPTTAADVQTTYRTGFGSATLDLSQVQFSPDARRSVTVSVGFGSLHVVVPPGIALWVDANDSAGAVRVLGQSLGSGLRVNRTYTSRGWSQNGVPHLTLVLDVEGGSISVEQASGNGQAPAAPARPKAPPGSTSGKAGSGGQSQ